MTRIYIDNLDAHVSEQDIEYEFQTYRVIRHIWVARKPPDYAFINFDNRRNAQVAIHDLDGKHNWRVEFSITLEVEMTVMAVIVIMVAAVLA